MSKSTVKQNVTCDECGKVCKDANGLRIHKLRIHEGKKWSSMGGKKFTKRMKAAKAKAKALHKRGRKATAALTVIRPVAAVATPVENEDVLHFNFCPVCACPVGLVGKALKVASKVQRHAPRFS